MMKKNTIVKLIVLIVIATAGFSPVLQAQTFTGVTYTSDNTNFANPERGFYHHTEVQAGNYQPLSESELRSYRTEGITIIMRVFYLELFTDSPISSSYLNLVEQDFVTARKAGIKVIVRFAYTQKSTPPYGDAKPDRVLQHIAQLTPLLRNNSDVIEVVQAGFVGAWGEWYYTDYFSVRAGNISAANWADRKNVITAYMNAVPSTRMIQVRTPQIKFNLTGSTTALTDAEAYTGTVNARLAHHNDCFLASADDYGTYVNMDQEKAFLEQETKYLAMGGETCGVDVPLSQCPNAVAQMKRFHWSFLNRDYHPDVISGWAAGGCIDDVSRQLGYRYRLTQSKLQQDAKPGSSVTFNFSIVNDGWSNVFNPRAVEIVLKNNTSGKTYRLKTSNDPRRWTLGDTTKIAITAGISEGIELASYSVFLNLPDPELALRSNPLYSIRLANTDTWQEATGFNDLKHILNVTATSAAPAYGGSDFFLSDDNVVVSLSTPTPLRASVFTNNTILYWGLTGNDNYRVIQRADDGVNFQTVATLTNNAFSFIDRTLTGTNYKYRSYATDGSAVSQATDAIDVTTKASAPIYYSHKADGLIGDWEAERPLTAVYSEGTHALRLFSSRDTLFVFAEGSGYASYRLFLDTDNNSATGIQSADWTTSGFDYRISGDSLYEAAAGAWNFIVKVQRASSDGVTEYATPLSSFKNLLTNLVINVAVKAKLSSSADLYLPLKASSSAMFIRALVPAALSSFIVNSSSRLPETELIISWQSCSSCKGYVLERSTGDANHFTTIAHLTKNQFIYYDDGLSTGTTYYYRAASYNEIGLGVYPETSSGTPAAITGLDEPWLGTTLYPNPVIEQFTLTSPVSYRVTLVDMQGRTIPVGEPELVSEGRRYHIGSIAQGVYLLKINSGLATKIIRVIKR